ncbi:S-adenosyl-L-methionine-dependent methyltransferase [Trametes coccinea BRFM310]|uniref:S-adenosyl-L-methionine-dependent methyltransferase n=1 Tax=Trametes coccinea (strain BRFM310) TaxID=1353009 RepID=A0A1Y2ILU1_TRAC3|nr:S-adenosyl-L-methionine-dependent methyltransferase [Trametes coccinea BRFM310]
MPEITAHHSAPTDPGHDYVEANKAYFDEHAEKLEQEHPHAREVSIKCVDGMRSNFPALFDRERTEAMDFACGTGLFSLAYRPYVKHILGVDISQGSVDVYNRRAAEQGLSQEMEAVCATLKGEPGELGDAKFDLITCSASFHHMPSIDNATRTLTHFLKPGGSLLVADIKAASDGKELVPEEYRKMVPHTHGLTEEQMRVAFEGAGLVDFELREMSPIKMGPTGQDIVWFIARGVKPVESS